MRICIFGMGAVGGHFGARLAAAGHEVSAVARGENLARIQADGITLRSGEETVRAQVQASDRPADLGVQDVVICTLKATALPDFAAGAAPLLGPDTAVVFAQNGIPWWYDMGISADRLTPPDLGRLDPGGALREAIAAERIIGGIVNSPNEMVEPGVVLNTRPDRGMLTLGAIDDRGGARLDALRAALIEAGIESPAKPDIRLEVWRKLIRNMTGSIIALLTGHRLKIVREDERIGDLFRRLSEEAVAIATAHGAGDLGFDAEDYIAAAPNHSPSIQQDYERGRPMELECMVLAPQAFARAAGLDTPHLDSIAALAVRKGIDKGLYAP